MKTATVLVFGRPLSDFHCSVEMMKVIAENLIPCNFIARLAICNHLRGKVFLICFIMHLTFLFTSLLPLLSSGFTFQYFNKSVILFQ